MEWLVAVSIVALFVFFVFVLPYMDRAQNAKEGKKYLALLRNLSDWSQKPIERNPHHAWSMMINRLNNRGDLRPYEVTYTNAKMIGATAEELWKIHRAVHRWLAEQCLEVLRKKSYMISRRGLFDEYLKKAECTLEDLHTDEAEYAALQKATLIAIIKDVIRESQVKEFPEVLMVLRNFIDDADVSTFSPTELDELAEETGLDGSGQAMLSMIARHY